MGLWRILHPPTGKEGQQPTYVVATGSVPKRPRARSPLRRRRFYRPSLSQTVFEIADLPFLPSPSSEREGRNEDRRTLSQTEEGREGREGGRLDGISDHLQRGGGGTVRRPPFCTGLLQPSNSYYSVNHDVVSILAPNNFPYKLAFPWKLA